MAFDFNVITKMPYWLARPASELDKLRKGAVIYWQRLSDLLAWPAKQLDPMTAEIELVHLLAWERDVEQIPQEDEVMYRVRVKFALQFAKGAGSTEGWLAMFKKLDMPYVEIAERFSVSDWDVINLKLTDDDLSERQNLINYIVRQYGRTARRYQYQTVAEMNTYGGLQSFDNHSDYTVAKIDQES
ncbi:hypothetical protein [Pseudoalteromonas sp. P1-7a]|uniref:hypothetical protein n=1 Tax=Pseudoalteromonas sp. P1-7a TaxID=1723755 RepID=UPI0006D67146|nr:hypothetical protein [Pseudoalteromonas sp. P1-7a]KPZ59514.1 hypothetical protein AN389_02660 [Pseudoalteromonas sp. P1-7a]